MTAKTSEQPTLLLEGGTVLTMDADRTRFDDGYVLIRGREIEAVRR